MASSRGPLRGESGSPRRDGAPTYYSALPTRTPKKKDNRVRNAVIALLAIVAIAFGVGWNPPHSTVHSFSSASDYRPAKESGCTNSGSGCHGQETSYKDFNAYHPDTKCGVCHAFQGVACIPCHAPNKNHECELCHDGSMKSAPDVVRLTDNYPNGHYRETTHTAMGDDYGAPMRVEPSAKASATCSDCHARDLRAAHTGVAIRVGSDYGNDIGCVECHNDVRSFGQAEVLAKWKSHTCEACHKVGSSAPMHPSDKPGEVSATDSAGCAESGVGCHEGSDLHAIHANAPATCSGSAAKGEPGCHKLGAEALKPTVTSCGGKTAGSCHKAGSKGSYRHKKVFIVHSPTTGAAAAATFDGVACGDCHAMAPNGKSLLTEHALSTSAKTLVPRDSCRNCHNSPASADALADKWSASGSADACQACHGHAGLAGLHGTDVSSVHTVSGSGGCASSGAGCHPTSDISSVGNPTTTSGIHSTCLRCHDRTGSDVNQPYDPTKKTCGAGRACHNGDGKFDPDTSVHRGNDGADALHLAGADQHDATYQDLATGLETPCGTCHDMRLGTEHTRPSVSEIADNPCTQCHNAEGSPDVVKSNWPDQESDNACGSCHQISGESGIHSGIDTAHVGTELGPDGLPAPGSCVKSGCHSSTDLRRLHTRSGCAVTGCHTTKGDIRGRNLTSCGGTSEFIGCHSGFSATEHFVSHAADISGTSHGIVYSAGANVGCFGCHQADLRTEHGRELAAGGMDGSAVNNCRVCHFDADDPGSGTYSGDPAVTSAIASRDRRCEACHASGSAADTSDAVASPHKQISADTPLPPGKVWSDPFDDWKAAFDSPTGGGHNVLPAGLVGGAKSKRFPVTDFVIGGQPYTWALPANQGTSTWLKASSVSNGNVDSTSGIQHVVISCDDCHALPDDMVGPHGAAIHVGIDPDYSQTEYSDPTPDAYQFEATGTDRVVCMKCHNLEASESPVVNPGGAPLHTNHVAHDDIASSNRHHYGEKCIDCHVRIPHAWKRPRLLVRTVVTTDGVSPDTYPYIPAGYNGLAGIVLRSFTAPSDLRNRYCATGGCHPGHSPTRHPLPSDIPTATYWP